MGIVGLSGSSLNMKAVQDALQCEICYCFVKVEFWLGHKLYEAKKQISSCLSFIIEPSWHFLNVWWMVAVNTVIEDFRVQKLCKGWCYRLSKWYWHYFVHACLCLCAQVLMFEGQRATSGIILSCHYLRLWDSLTDCDWHVDEAGEPVCPGICLSCLHMASCLAFLWRGGLGSIFL